MQRLQLCFELEESTSASTLLLSSIDGARRQAVRDGRELLDRAIRAAELPRERIAAEVPELEVVDLRTRVGRPGVAAADPTHLMIETRSIGLTGYQADDWLRDERSIDIELADHRRITPLFTFAHGEPRWSALCPRYATSSIRIPIPGVRSTWHRCPRATSCARSRFSCGATRSSRAAMESSRKKRRAGSAPSS
jgi:hypothetical protein